MATSTKMEDDVAHAEENDLERVDSGVKEKMAVARQVPHSLSHRNMD